MCAGSGVHKKLISKLTGKTKTALIYGDNIGSLFLAANQQVSQRTKHIDIQHQYLREWAKNGEVATKFCWSEENQANVMTKNATVQCFRQHYPSISSIDAERWREDVEK